MRSSSTETPLPFSFLQLASTLSLSFLDWKRMMIGCLLPVTVGPVLCAASRSSSVVGMLIRSVKIQQHFLAQLLVVSLASPSTLYTLRFHLWSYCCRLFWSLRTFSIFCSCLLSCSFISAFSFLTEVRSLLRMSISFPASKHLPSSLSNCSITWEVSLSTSLLNCCILSLVARVWNCLLT